jgi:hypothetical protein
VRSRSGAGLPLLGEPTAEYYRHLSVPRSHLDACESYLAAGAFADEFENDASYYARERQRSDQRGELHLHGIGWRFR